MDLLVLADRDGVVDMTLDAISRRTNVPEEIVAHAIAVLSEEDRKSRSHEELGRRLVPIDSHRDWGWQIVNYEHYRDIKDEEARRAYFRDKKREQRAKEAGPTLSNGVKDSPHPSNNVTQAEVEAEANTETKAKAPSAKVLFDRDRSTGGNGELMAATHVWEELGIATTQSDVQVLAKVIRFEAKRAKTDTENATGFLLQSAQAAMERGEIVNAFWFRDRKFTQEGGSNGHGDSRGQFAKELIEQGGMGTEASGDIQESEADRRRTKAIQRAIGR